MVITYVVAKIQPSCGGNKEVKRFEFDDVKAAINKELDVSRGFQEEAGHWEIFVEYCL